MNFNFKNIFSNIKNVIVIVKSIDDPPSQPPKLVCLCLSDNLLTIRKELERNSSINDTLLFSKKYPEINDNYGFAEITFEKEDDFLLDDIIDEVGKYGGVEVRVASSSNYSKGKSNYFKLQCTKLIGGEQSSLENFDEKTWVKSLKDYKTWDCIEFRGPISIFQILPKDLLEQIIKSIGKRIHYATTKDFNYYLERIERPKKFELDIPSNISKIIQNKAADCNIFATVIDTAESKNDFFTCQVLCPPDGKPKNNIKCAFFDPDQFTSR
uniref:Crinkler family protein n=1 Tax=Rhizophagus irregularis (strain DAOM 181602 / DAOM 197198 / MUCL 43194) TaxID=747089 RepID=U9TTV0_RHIID